MAAQLDNFPEIDLADLPKVLFHVNMMGLKRAEQVGAAVIRKYRKIRKAQNELLDDEILLNRVKFAEVLLMVIKANDTIEHSPEKARSSVVVPQMDSIPEIEEEGAAMESEKSDKEDEEEESEPEPDSDTDPDFMYSMHLGAIFSSTIVPILERDNEETMPVSLNAFRDRYVWREQVNSVLEMNLEGIMEVFSKFMDEPGFTLNSAEKVLKGISCLLPPRMIRKLFDLSQMTVIDESVNAAEYDDMELVEFLEFLVRVAFHQYLGEDRTISVKLSDLLREVLSLAN